jgi:hypothetical protein
MSQEKLLEMYAIHENNNSLDAEVEESAEEEAEEFFENFICEYCILDEKEEKERVQLIEENAKLKAEIATMPCNLFIRACKEDELAAAKWLCNIYNIHPEVDIKEEVYEDIFCHACRRGDLEVAQWLYEINPAFDIYATDACDIADYYGQSTVLSWLLHPK